jgi:hypothetical protein
VVGRFRPSQSVLGCWQSPVVGSSCPRLVTPTAAGGGRLNLASSQAIQYRFPPPLGRLWQRYPEVVSGPSPGPRVAPAARLQLPARVRWVAGLGLGGVAEGVRGVLDSWLPAAVHGRLCAAVQPAVGGLSTAESRGLTPRWSSESVCLYRKPLADSSSWMRGLTCRSASLGGLEAAIPGGGLRAIARASGGALCPAQRHRPGPVRVVQVGRCGGGDVSLPCFRVGLAARACPAERFQSHLGVQAPRRG